MLKKLLPLPLSEIKKALHSLLYCKPTPVTPEEVLVTLHTLEIPKDRQAKEYILKAKDGTYTIHSYNRPARF